MSTLEASPTVALPQFPDGNTLTHSSTKCWNACRRRYYFSYILGVRRAYQSEPLRIGSMWHTGVGMYESGSTIGAAEEAIRDAYKQEICPPYLTADEYAVEEETVVAMVRGHHKRYEGDGILESIAIELPFKLPIINPETGRTTPSFKDAGKIDRIARLPDGTVAIVERKTTSESIEPDAPYWKALRNDPQISRYFLASRALGHNTTKIVYDVIRKPSIRPRQVTKAERAMATANANYHGLKLTAECPERETPKMYGARLYADMIARPAFYFSRVEIARIDADLEEFAYDRWQSQQEIQQAMRNGRFYRNPASCLEPYTCEFLDVCHELNADPKNIPSGFRRAKRLHEELSEPPTETAVQES